MAEKKSDSNDTKDGCLGLIILVVIIAVVIGGCHAYHRSNNSGDSRPKTHLTSKQKALN